MSKINELFDKIRESQAFQELRGKYDQLDSQTKLYVQLGGLGAAGLLVSLSLILSIGRLNSIKREIDDQEAMIGYLQKSSEQIKKLKAEQDPTQTNTGVTQPLPQLIDSVLLNSGIDKEKVEVSGEASGAIEGDAQEFTTDVKLTRSNLRQITRFLFSISEQGAFKTIHIKDLTIDTKEDPKGYMDAMATISSLRPKNGS